MNPLHIPSIKIKTVFEETKKNIRRNSYQDENEGELVMTSSNNNGDIVTVDTDTSDAESVYNVYNTSNSHGKDRNMAESEENVSKENVSSLVCRGRKKSRMVAFPFLE